MTRIQKLWEEPLDGKQSGRNSKEEGGGMGSDKRTIGRVLENMQPTPPPEDLESQRDL